MWSDWLVVCDCGFSLSALWCPLSVPTILLGFLLPWTWGISSRWLQQSAAAAPYLGCGVTPLGCHPDLGCGVTPLGCHPDLGCGVAPLGCRPWPWTWGSSSRPLLHYATLAPAPHSPSPSPCPAQPPLLHRTDRPTNPWSINFQQRCQGSLKEKEQSFQQMVLKQLNIWNKKLTRQLLIPYIEIT